MSALTFASLTQALPLRDLLAPSRVVFAAHRTNFATRRTFGPRHVAYYEARARGGVGVVVLETSTVHPSDWPYEYAPLGFEGSVVAGYAAVARAIHRHGSLALASLGHTGGQGSSHYSQGPLWAPSAVPEVNSREVPMEMEPADVDAIVLGFARAATFALEGGLDGVEINVGQSSLLRQFLSPLTNKRRDEYGGNLEARARFALAVISAVRKAIGPSAVLGVRVSGDEYAPWAGLVPETAAEAAGLLAGGAGVVDFVSVTSGSIYSQHLTRAGLFAPPGYAASLAERVKGKVRVPVFAQGSIVDAEMAEALLREGKADAVEMTRALLADPELVAKLRAEKSRDIRPCVLCNQDCVVESVQNPTLSCLQNPAAGHESEDEFSTLSPAPVKRRVLVVGAGPAGMEAARVAALRGHDVTLIGERVGGTVGVAAAAPGRARLGLVTAWLEEQLRSLGVTVREETADLEALASSGADVLLRCTGARPARRRFVEFAPDAPVVSPREVLAGTVERGASVHAVVLDEAGDHSAMGAAEWLAEKGWSVSVVTADMFVGQRLTATLELTPYNQRAAQKALAFRPQLEVVRVLRGRVLAVDVFSRAPVTLEADLVVDASYEVPRPLDLPASFGRVAGGASNGHCPRDGGEAGDAVAPRRIGHAILEGQRLGRSV